MASSKELIAQLGQDPETAFAAYKALEDQAAAATAPGNESARQALAAELAAELVAMTPASKNEKGKEVPPEPVHSAGARTRMVRLLATAGSANEVPVLVQAMGDLELRDMALFALTGIVCPASTEALVQASENVDPLCRIAAINGLSKRSGPQALAALQKASKDADPAVSIAAVEALACIPEAGNDEYIAKACGCDCPTTKARAGKARVRLAETLAKAGNKGAAKTVYRAIASGNGGEPQKKAAGLALKAM